MNIFSKTEVTVKITLTHQFDDISQPLRMIENALKFPACQNIEFVSTKRLGYVKLDDYGNIMEELS